MNNERIEVIASDDDLLSLRKLDKNYKIIPRD